MAVCVCVWYLACVPLKPHCIYIPIYTSTGKAVNLCTRIANRHTNGLLMHGKSIHYIALPLGSLVSLRSPLSPASLGQDSLPPCLEARFVICTDSLSMHVIYHKTSLAKPPFLRYGLAARDYHKTAPI